MSKKPKKYVLETHSRPYRDSRPSRYAFIVRRDKIIPWKKHLTSHAWQFLHYCYSNSPLIKTVSIFQ